MARNPRTRSARRTLTWLLLIALAMSAFIGIARAVTRDEPNPAQRALLHPKLGLDLEGGTEIILEPVLQGDQQVSAGQLEQAVSILRQRIDANGVAETEITTLGGRNVVISIPGEPTKEQLDALRKPTQLRFRSVLAISAGTNPATIAPSPSTPATDGATPSTPATPALTPAATPSTPATTPASSAATPATTPATVPTPTWTAGSPLLFGMLPTATSTAPPANASDVNWVTPDVLAAYHALDCAKPGIVDTLPDDSAKPMVTCSGDLSVKYILGPVEIEGQNIQDATSGFQIGQNGQPTSIVEVGLRFDGDGTKAFANVTQRLTQWRAASDAAPQDVRNQFAIVLDKYVISAPRSQAVIADGRASITGGFTIDSARTLAQQLKFGALPMSFTLKNQDSITPTLGSEQLRLGLLAGVIGFILVIIYSLFQYRALGLVTVTSLVIAASLTYLAVTLLGFTHNYRLTMAGVTGLIVAIGVTADSFIVYFERIRDEVREGRSLVAAVETGWKRARRTIIVADLVNFLAAAVLYLLASDKVRGFAFTLGLTTIIDLVVVMMFTHPVVSMLAHTKFFGGGHKWSGLDPERLGATTSFRYAGRGRFTGPEPDPDPTPPRRASNYPGADSEGAVL